MTIDDLIGAIRISDPQLAPDGRSVAFVRTVTDLKTGARNADIWMVSTDGRGEPKELIAGDKSENTPRFSADGKLAFISTREDGVPQVYIADADGGNVRKVTDLAMGVQPPLVISADGSKVAFVSDVFPECGDEDCNKRKKEESDKNPVKARRIDRLFYRHWDEWRNGVRHHVFVTDVESRRTVFVEEPATVRGTVTAPAVTVAGQLGGQIRCSGRVELTPTARVTGEIAAGTLIMREGAFFEGELRMASGDADTPTVKGTTAS